MSTSPEMLFEPVDAQLLEGLFVRVRVSKRKAACGDHGRWAQRDPVESIPPLGSSSEYRALVGHLRDHLMMRPGRVLRKWRRPAFSTSMPFGVRLVDAAEAEEAVAQEVGAACDARRL